MLITFLALLLNLADAAFLGIGLFITLPMTAFIMARSYNSIDNIEP